MKHYSQLTLEQRYIIKLMFRIGYSQTEIAQVLGVHKSTISRELIRNRGGRGYRHKQAHTFAKDRKKGKVLPRIDGSTWAYVEQLICKEWSPEQISGWMKQNMEIAISHDWIYQYVLKDKQAIVSMTERKSGLVLIYKVDRRTKENTTDAIKRLLESISDQVLTITSDNGKEFANHKDIAKGLKCDFYFAHPYSSWERGTNENTNGLIRQYFPKNRDFRTITDKEIIHAMKRLNNRPRKRLGYKTPNEVFFDIELTVALTT